MDNYREDFTSEDNNEPTFLDVMLSRVKRDFERAKDFMEPFHTRWKEQAEYYYNSQKYEELRQKNLFPIPMTQELVDQFVSHITDKLFFDNRPCTLVGVEETDKPDADAKQEMIDWQDYKDNMATKIEGFARDTCIYDICVSKVDYEELTKSVWQVQEVDMPAPELATTLHKYAGIMPTKKVKVWNKADVVTYKGATVDRIDPLDFYITSDKRKIDDEHPIMVESKRSLDYFKSRDYFINIEELEIKTGAADVNLSSKEKDEIVGLVPATNTSEKEYQYVEWQGLVNEAELAKFSGIEIEGIDPNNKVWAICGVVDGRVVVRLEKQQHDLGHGNFVVGCVQKNENSLIGIGPVQKIMPCHRGSEIILGILLENLKQSVAAPWIMNTATFLNKRPPINTADQIIEVNGDVDKAMKRVEQPPIAKDLYLVLNMLRQWSLDAFGLQDITAGKGDPNAETLGEANMVEINASLRMRKYLKTFEETFIQPLYDMRNQINENMLDSEYIYGVIGKSAVEWRTISPQQIRASVDFICESSTRESNRAVMMQQMLQMIKLAPEAISNGMPVRVDRMIQKLAETGFSMSRESLHEWFPLLKYEDKGELNLDEMMVQTVINQWSMGLAMSSGGGNMGGGGGPMPSPKTESEAIQSATQSQQPPTNVPI